MTDELTLSGKQYISSKRASESSGYTQDYIGQLARAGHVDAQRIGGLWYVSLESLNGHKIKADEYMPPKPEYRATTYGQDQFVAFDGKDYVSASRASELTGYHPDYVGQLARSGKVLSRQIGNRWYVERTGILAHKEQKDALLAAVQAEAVGLARTPVARDRYAQTSTIPEPTLTYLKDDAHLLPLLQKESRVESLDEEEMPSAEPATAREIPIRRLSTPLPLVASPLAERPSAHRRHEKTNRTAALAAGALTVIMFLSFGISFLGGTKTFASRVVPGSDSGLSAEAMTASVAAVIDWIGSVLEPFVSSEIVFRRGQ